MRIVSWNIQWGRGVDGQVDLGRPAAVLKGFDADVMCLQEVAVRHPGLPGGADDDQPAHLAELFPGYQAIYGVGSDLAGDGGRRQFGNLVLSRLPIAQAFRHLLPWPPDAAVPSMPRVAVEAVLSMPGGALRLVTTHLEYYSAAQRAVQVEALRQLQAEGDRHARRPRASTEPDPPFKVVDRGRFAVFCGDFNFPPAAPEYARMQAPIADDVPSLIDAWAIAHPGRPHAPTVGVHEPGFPGGAACFDHFFVSENLGACIAAVTVEAQTDASDHQPIVLDLVWRP